MRYIRTFESHNIDESKVKETWGVDPYLFFDIVNSSLEEMNIWGELNITFAIFHSENDKQRPLANPDIFSCFYLGHKGLKFGPDGYNLDDLNKCITGKRGHHCIDTWEIKIEAIIEGSKNKLDKKDDSKFNIIDNRLKDSNTPYKLGTVAPFGESIYLKFDKI